MMKTIKSLFAIVLSAALILFNTGCSDDDEPTALTLVSLTAGGVDLAGVSSATSVPEDAAIEAVFSADIDEATATAANFSVTKTDDNSEVSYTISVSGSTVTLTPENGWDGGTQFSITLGSTIASTAGATFSGNNLTFRTSGIFVPSKENQVLFLSFDESATADESGDHTVSTVGTLGFVEDRRGTANSAAYFDGTGNLVEVAASADLISENITISYWIKTEESDYSGQDGSDTPQTRFIMGLGVEKGYFLEVGRRSNNPDAEGYGEFFLKYATNQINIGNNSTEVPKATAWTEINSQINVNFESGSQSGWSFALDQLQEDPPNRSFLGGEVMGNWTHIVMTIDAATQEKSFFINGVKWGVFKWNASGADWLFSGLSLKTENNDGSAIEGIEGSLALGFAGSSTNTATGWANHATTQSNDPIGQKFYKGAIDQFRIFNVALSETDIQQLYDNEK